MGEADQQHLDWLARSFGRADYNPLSRADYAAIQGVGETVSFAAGAHLFEEGEPAVAAFVIERGDVEVHRGRGSRRRVVARSGPGSMLGDQQMLAGTPHIATARALMSVSARRFSRPQVLRELAAQPGILLRWLLAGIRRMEESQRMLIGLMHKTVLAQVADLLVEESARQPDVNLSQASIGDLLGVSRQSVNEALGRLRDQGVVDTGYRRILVLDPDRLRSIAET